MPVAVLLIIGIVVAALLAGVNAITSKKIEEDRIATILASLAEVMPDGEFDVENPRELTEDMPGSVKAIYDTTNGCGTVVILERQGYASVIGVTVGVDPEGKITRAVVTSEQESHGKAEMSTYIDKFTGLSPSEVDETATFTGATATSGAMKGAVRDALVALGHLEAEDPLPELPRDEAEIAARAAALYGNDAAKLNVTTPADATFVKRIYAERGSDAYVAYAFAYSRYGAPEFEFLIYVDADGTVKAIDKILWKVSDPMPAWGYNPPSDAEVDAFFESFVGTNASTVVSVNVSTGATNTATNVRNAAKEALEIHFEMPNYAPRIIGISILALGAASALALVLIKKKRRAVK